MTRMLLVLTLLGGSACAIPSDDLLPGIGQPCRVSEGLCPVEHTCRPESPGTDNGVCAPVLDFGACDKPTHPAGRVGTVEEGDVVVDEAADANKLDDVRLIKGALTVARRPQELDLGDLCHFRTLQRVGDTMALGNTDVKDTSGLQSLTSVRHGLALFGNGELRSLEGLQNLVEIEPCTDGTRSVQLIIARNDRLPASAIDTFLDDLEVRLGKAPQVLRCENGPVTDRDPLCAGDADIVDALQDGEAVCR